MQSSVVPKLQQEPGVKTTERASLTTAMVSEDRSDGITQHKKKGRVKRRKQNRARVSDDSDTQRRAGRRRVREKVSVASIVGSLAVLEHDSSDLIVVHGSVNGQRCRDVLVDPGASSNFVRRDWALSQRLPVQQLKTPLAITMGDGHVIHQVGAVRIPSMDAQGSSAPCTLLVMDQLNHHIILGMPWLRRAGVTVEFGEVMRWNGKPMLRMQMRSDSGPQLHTIKAKIAPEYEKIVTGLMTKYSRAFSKELPRQPTGTKEHAVHCTLTLKDPKSRPVVCPERRYSPADFQTQIDFVIEEERAGRIQKSQSPWKSQLVMVRKMRDGVELSEKRPCIDLRRVNDLIAADAHPLPLPEDMFAKLKGCKVFSKLDLTKGFWQIPMDKLSKELLAFSTPLGLYEPNSMPFGMKNAPAIFQREMTRVFKDRLWNGVMVFIDDILIYSKTPEEHAEILEWVLKTLQEQKYYANPDKCEFFQREVSFLGHIISEKGVAVQQHKVKAVTEWPEPKSKKHVRGFLGLTGYYRKFVNKYSDIALPLTNLTKNDVTFCWTQKEQVAFDMLKLKLSTADVLAHPDPQRQYMVTTDASAFAISGVLSQDQSDGKRRPVAYFSRKLSGAAIRYSTYDKELFAIVSAVEHWRCYLEGSPHPILFLSDHRSLQHLNTQPKLNDRQARWVEKLSEFEFKVQHIAGSVNVAADALSRRPDYEEAVAAERDNGADAPIVADQPRVKVTLAAIAAADSPKTWEVRLDAMPLREDMKVAALRDAVYQESVNQPQPRTDGLTVAEGLLWTSDGLCYVPDDLELKRRLIHEVHDTPTGGHMGLRKTLIRLCGLCYWPGMKSMIADYIGGCTTCAAVKSSMQKPAGLLRPLPIPERPWQVMTIDFVGPLPMTPDFFDTILVVTDKFSKRGHFIPTTKHVTSEKTARLILEHVVKYHAAIPGAIISDRGTQFTSLLFKELWTALGTDLRFSTSYHPQSDGQTERLNRELEQQLRMHANRAGSNWKEWLSVVEMHYNSDVHESTGKTPYEMTGVDYRDALTLALQQPMQTMKSEDARLMLDGIKTTWEDARRRMLKQREQQKKNADRLRRDERYKVGDLVMLSTENLPIGRGKLTDRYIGPLKVLEVRDNGVNVKLELPKEFIHERTHPVFHVEKLKRFVPSSIQWPGRVQPPRPTPVIEHGKKKWWLKRIVGKKEQEVLERVPIPVNEGVKEGGEVQDSKDEENVVDSLEPMSRRVSPRLQSSTRGLEAPKPGKQTRKKYRFEKRTKIFYLVEWELSEDQIETSWEPQESLVKQGLQEFIDDYETRQLGTNGQLELGLMCEC
jgi:hypothetical protein